MDKKDFVKTILAEAEISIKPSGSGFASANIALCKYWGKRDNELNLPANSSLSIGLKNHGTSTKISINREEDTFILNSERQMPDKNFSRRLSAYLDLFRFPAAPFFTVETVNSIPTAAGLASSASGFAAIVMALNELFSWKLSFWDGFVLWHRGEKSDGTDSFAEPIDIQWPGLCIGIINISSAEKEISSRKAMIHTAKTSPFYDSWVAQAEKDVVLMLNAIKANDFALFGSIAENNAAAMHASMLAARPPVSFLNHNSHEVINKIWSVRKAGKLIYWTADAGPNIKAIFLKEDLAELKEIFNFWGVVEY